MADIFTEVDEEVRRERALKLWRRYGNYLIGAAVVVVAATAGWTAWRDYDRRQAEAQAARFVAAADLEAAGENDKALAAFGAIAKDGRAGYAVLARLREAAIKARTGDAGGAAATYHAVASDGSAPPELRNVATILAAMVDIERLPPADLERRLAALAEGTSPWRHTAFELMAIAAARAGDAARARELYAKIADDPAAPPGLRARAAEMLAALPG